MLTRSAWGTAGCAAAYLETGILLVTRGVLTGNNGEGFAALGLLLILLAAPMTTALAALGVAWGRRRHSDGGSGVSGRDSGKRPRHASPTREPR